MADAQPVAFVSTTPFAGTGAAQVVASAAVRGSTVAAAGWNALSKVPSVAGSAAQIPNTQVVHDMRKSVTVDTPREQAAAAECIIHKYRVAATAIGQLVEVAHQTGREIGLDPLSIPDVMVIESDFNPLAGSGMGAQGLMQVMTEVHQDKCEAIGSVGAALNPYTNAEVDALVLEGCITRAGSIEGSPKLYVGAVTRDNGGYGNKVLQKRSRLCMAVTGHRSPVTMASEREPARSVATVAPVAQADVRMRAVKLTDKPAPHQ